MLEKQLVVNETLMNYIEFNHEASQALVFLHGWQSNLKVWMPILERLSSGPVRVVALDLPGFGRSPIPKSTWGVEEYSGLVKNFMVKIGLQEAILVGHSFGGRIAIRLSEQNPEMIKKLLLVDAAGFKDEKIFTKLKILAAKTIKPVFNLPGIKELKERAYRLAGAKDYADAGPLRAIFAKTISEDLTGYMLKIKSQTLLVWGAKDQETPLAFGQLMNQLIPNSKLVIFENAGHFSFLDEPEKFTELIRGLL